MTTIILIIDNQFMYVQNTEASQDEQYWTAGFLKLFQGYESFTYEVYWIVKRQLVWDAMGSIGEVHTRCPYIHRPGISSYTHTFV